LCHAERVQAPANLQSPKESGATGSRICIGGRRAGTLHKHIRQEEFYFVLEGTGRLRVGDETLTVPRYGGVLVGPDQLRQVFNDTDAEVLWLIIGAPEELEFLPGAKTKPDMSLIYPTDPTQLPKELAGVQWPAVELRLIGNLRLDQFGQQRQ
jgi:mannose-6-phosphate isomerase-like protein (cupin superfamily)